MDVITELDLRFNLLVQENFRKDTLTAFMKFFTRLNNYGIMAIGAVVLFLLFQKYREVGAVMGLSLLIQVVLNNLILKNVIARPRPYEVSDAVILLIEKARDYSFPSGHTGSVFAVTFVIWFLLRKELPIAAFLAVTVSALMGFSRIYVGIHYPSDVLGGVLLGLFSAVITIRLVERYDERLRRYFIEKK